MEHSICPFVTEGCQRLECVYLCQQRTKPFYIVRAEAVLSFLTFRLRYHMLPKLRKTVHIHDLKTHNAELHQSYTELWTVNATDEKVYKPLKEHLGRNKTLHNFPC